MPAPNRARAAIARNRAAGLSAAMLKGCGLMRPRAVHPPPSSAASSACPLALRRRRRRRRSRPRPSTATFTTVGVPGSKLPHQPRHSQHPRHPPGADQNSAGRCRSVRRHRGTRATPRAQATKSGSGTAARAPMPGSQQSGGCVVVPSHGPRATPVTAWTPSAWRSTAISAKAACLGSRRRSRT